MIKNWRQKLYDKATTISFMFERLRIWSRAGLGLYMILLHQLVFWVFGLPDITTAQTIIVSVISGLATPIMAFYMKSGQNLYKEYINIEYNSSVVEFIDHLGFIIDKFRIIPLLSLVYYCFLLYLSLQWGMDLGHELSVAQATFISTFAGTASVIFGFFITTGEVNSKMVEVYKDKNDIDDSDENNSSPNDLDETVDEFINTTKNDIDSINNRPDDLDEYTIP